jgi:hypothetical protein
MQKSIKIDHFIYRYMCCMESIFASNDVLASSPKKIPIQHGEVNACECGIQASPSCCQSPWHAASAGHYDCYKLLIAHEPETDDPFQEPFRCLCSALGQGNVEFACRLFHDFKR